MLLTSVETELANIGKRPDVVLEIDAVPAIADLVAEGLGYGLVTMNAMRVPSRETKFEFHRIIAPTLRSTLVVAISGERPTTTLAQRAVELLQSLAAQELQGKPGPDISKSRYS